MVEHDEGSMATDPKALPDDDLSEDEIDRLVRQGLDELDETDRSGTVTVLECPECGKSDLSYVAGMETGRKYKCPHCDYEGAFVIERERTPEELRRQAGLE